MNQYKNYTPDQFEELFSNYLIPHWSYSGQSTFARNEKAFEMQYIFRERSKSSASAVAGKAYHSALDLFFKAHNKGIELELIELEQHAINYIDNTPADSWKLQKTTPTVQKCMEVATKSVVILCRNFIQEKDIYMHHIKRVLAVELNCKEFLTINGIDIPLPCHAFIDLIFETHDGLIVVLDHKSKKAFAKDEDMMYTGGKQAMTYVLCYEAKTGRKVDEAWFIENKSSINKDGSPQLKATKITLDNDTRYLYEALLYENIKRMLDAVSDPDYVFIINDNDTLSDTSELYAFWAKTYLADVDAFDIEESKKDIISKRLKNIKKTQKGNINPTIVTDFKQKTTQFIKYDMSKTDMTKTEKVEYILKTFACPVQVAHEINGFSSDTFLLEVGAGVRVTSILKHKLDIANALDVANIRLSKNLLVYEGKSYLPVEISKKRTEDLVFNPDHLDGQRLPVGINNFGEILYWDLNNHSTPHALVCGATGSGKSVFIKSTLEYALKAGIDDIIIFDPKFEFCEYASNNIQVVSDIDDIEYELSYLVEEMQARARDKVSTKKLVIFDEFADAISAGKKGEIEKHLRMLAQKGRSLGYRILAATQRASVKVITGDAKVNFPIQICFRVPKEIDSKVVIDEAGAETLTGLGDGLMKSPEYLNISRFQGYYKA
ncbi:MAG: DNA translocase FtsK [Bacteroidales bacterium]|jgi:S-DNA-T family DNA segregation ATPase FtsK/SpoIIIE|nr:DNA translocase FtsK [Bacteroidales bacterium]